MIFKILRPLLDTLTTDDKYYLLSRDNLKQPIQMQLSKKEKQFSQFFAAFSKFTSNFEHFKKTDDPQSLCIFEVRDCE